MMYIFRFAASTWGDAYSHRPMCDNLGTIVITKLYILLEASSLNPIRLEIP